MKAVHPPMSKTMLGGPHKIKPPSEAEKCIVKKIGK